MVDVRAYTLAGWVMLVLGFVLLAVFKMGAVFAALVLSAGGLFYVSSITKGMRSNKNLTTETRRVMSNSVRLVKGGILVLVATALLGLVFRNGFSLVYAIPFFIGVALAVGGASFWFWSVIRGR